MLPQYTGISFPYVYSAFYAPVAYWFNKLFDKIPFIRGSNLSAETIRKRFGALGEPGIIGFILGILMGVLGRYNFASTTETGIKLGASMYFIPLSTKILIEGLDGAPSPVQAEVIFYRYSTNQASTWRC